MPFISPTQESRCFVLFTVAVQFVITFVGILYFDKLDF